MQIGSYVIRKKYKGDILFKIDKIIDGTAIVKGVYIRMIATALLEDLIEISQIELNYYNKLFSDKEKDLESFYQYNKNHKTGKILHIDSDMSYLVKCNKIYEDLGLYAICILLDSRYISKYILELVGDYCPDIVVLTGHDSYNQKDIKNLENYQNTKDYINATKLLRKYYSLNDLYIFAGACGSNFEALIASGANSASSPKRVNIDAYDPAICAVKAATTPFDQIISFKSIWEHSLTKEDGIGGVESFGYMRMIM